jgi:hypothetical protein
MRLVDIPPKVIPPPIDKRWTSAYNNDVRERKGIEGKVVSG